MASTKNIFKLHRKKSEATTRPVKSVSQLKGVWAREFAVYRVVVVEVRARKGSVLHFDIIDDPSAPRTAKKGKPKSRGGQYKVDLDDGFVVWSDLPSTAQLVDPKSDARIGYLCLTENWLFENLPDNMTFAATVAGGPKIPPRESL